MDDFGVQPFNAGGRSSLLDIIEDLHDKSTSIISAQVTVKKWYEVIGEKTLADAIPDTIVHKSLEQNLWIIIKKKARGQRRNNRIIFIAPTDKS